MTKQADRAAWPIYNIGLMGMKIYFSRHIILNDRILSIGYNPISNQKVKKFGVKYFVALLVFAHTQHSRHGFSDHNGFCDFLYCISRRNKLIGIFVRRRYP